MTAVIFASIVLGVSALTYGVLYWAFRSDDPRATDLTEPETPA
jgi:hypothetical protein